LLAPFIPFMAETIYRNLTKENSIHLSSWPEKEWEIDEKLINEMSFLRAIIENIHSARKQEKIPVRQPLSEVVVYLQNSKQINNKILKIGLEEVNVKKISIKEGNDKVVLNTKITFLLAEEGKVRELIRKVQEERKKKGLNLTQKISISNIWVPQDKKQIQQILTKTLGTSLVKGDFGIKKA
jgi:isoleucyl-tRNA synthetase